MPVASKSGSNGWNAWIDPNFSHRCCMIIAQIVANWGVLNGFHSLNLGARTTRNTGRFTTRPLPVYFTTNMSVVRPFSGLSKDEIGP